MHCGAFKKVRKIWSSHCGATGYLSGVGSAAPQVWPLAWHSGLRLWHCHGCCVGRSCGSDSFPSPGTNIYHGCGQKKKKKKGKENPQAFYPLSTKIKQQAESREITKWGTVGVLLWYSRLSLRHYPCSGSGCRCGMGIFPYAAGMAKKKKKERERMFPLWLCGLQTQLESMRMQLQSLASLNGLGFWCWCKLWHRSQMWLGSRVAVAVA